MCTNFFLLFNVLSMLLLLKECVFSTMCLLWSKKLSKMSIFSRAGKTFSPSVLQVTQILSVPKENVRTFIFNVSLEQTLSSMTVLINTTYQIISRL